MKPSTVVISLFAYLGLWCAATAATHAPLWDLGISKDGRALEFRRSTDAKVQHIDILAKCGVPAIGKPRIGWFKRDAGSVNVVYGKHCFASVAIKDLTVSCTGCD